MKQALLISRSFPPVRHSGTIRMEAFARHLPASNFTPMVLTARTPAEFVGSTDRVIPESKRVEIDWSPTGGLFRRRLARFPVGLSIDRRRNRRTLATRSIEACRERGARPDIVLASCQPGDTLFIGVKVAEYFQCPCVVDFRDPWSYWPMPLYPHWLDFQLERREEHQVLAAATAITVTTKASGQLLESEFGVPAHKIHQIHNGYEPSEFAQPEVFEPMAADANRFHIVYAGEIGSSRPLGWKAQAARGLGFQYDPLQTNYTARSPRFFLEGLERFISEAPERASAIRAWFIGDAKLASDPAVLRFRYPDVLRIVPRVPPRVAIGAIQQASLLLMLQLETFLHGVPFCVAVPGKLYSYLASGQRILAAVQPSENTELIERFQAGTCVSPTSPAEFASAIGNEYVRWKSGTSPPVVLRSIPEFERSCQTAQMAALFESLISSRS